MRACVHLREFQCVGVCARKLAIDTEVMGMLFQKRDERWVGKETDLLIPKIKKRVKVCFHLCKCYGPSPYRAIFVERQNYAVFKSASLPVCGLDLVLNNK